MDLKEDCVVSESQSSSSSNGNINGNNELKKCTDCQTTTTPLWRGGPAGPKTLCNACGIKYHKKRRALLGLDKGKVEKKNTNNKKNIINHNKSTSLGMPLKIKMMTSGFRKSEKLGEVEQAALLLMALSYGSVYA